MPATLTRMTPDLEIKAFDGLALPATPVEDEPGTVEALVAVTGNTDDGGDIILPGAIHFKRAPKVVWSHDLKTLVGKVLEYEEWAPGDPRLPADLLAMGCGALWFKVLFDLEDPESFKAYRKVVFHEDLGWSIGYEVDPEGFKIAADGRRLLSKIYVWEGSPTTFGMNQEARTMSAKSLIHSTLDRLELPEAKAKAVQDLIETLVSEARPEEEKAMVPLADSYEATQEVLRQAVRAWATEVYGETSDENDWWVSIEGTYDDRVVASIRVYRGDGQDGTFQFPYTYGEDDVILLGEAVEVELQATVVAEPTAPQTASLSLDIDAKALADALEETKKGRVLSAANAAALQAAAESIQKVLEAAAPKEDEKAVVARQIVPKGQGGTIETKTASPEPDASTDPSSGPVQDPEDEGEAEPISDADLLLMEAAIEEGLVG